MLQRQIDANLELERRDGIRRHFAYPWHVVAEYNPAYGQFAESERARLGADHPLFLTQYELRTISGEAAFIGPRLRAQLWGTHPARSEPLECAEYVAALDVAGRVEAGGAWDVGATGDEGGVQPASPHGRGRPQPGEGHSGDATALLVARVDRSVEGLAGQPRLLVEAGYLWRGEDMHAQFAPLLDLLREVWRVRHLVVDATGVGAGLASFLLAALGDAIVEPFVYTAGTKSELAYNLLAVIGAGLVKWYAGDEVGEKAKSGKGEGTEASLTAELRAELEACRYAVRPNRTMAFAVPDGRGHDDLINALALLAWAGRAVPPEAAGVLLPARVPYQSRDRFREGMY